MNKKNLCLLVILGGGAAANLAVVLAGKGFPAQHEVWDQTELPAQLKERVIQMIGDRHYPEAIQALRNYLRYDPKDGDMRRLLGKVLFDSGRYDEARDAYYAVLLNDPDDFVARNNMGVVLMKQGRVNDARRELKDAFDASGRELFVAANLAKSYEQSGNSAEAGKIWNSIREDVHDSGGVVIPDDALMLADAETIKKLQSVRSTAAERP